MFYLSRRTSEIVEGDKARVNWMSLCKPVRSKIREVLNHGLRDFPTKFKEFGEVAQLGEQTDVIRGKARTFNTFQYVVGSSPTLSTPNIKHGM